MIIHQIPVRNPLRNYVYLLADEETKEALVIDPLAYQACLDAAKELGVKIKKVLNTHEHHDHIGGNAKLIAATGATLYAPEGANIPNVDKRFQVGEDILVGRYVLTVLDTPGHTMSHICLYYAGDKDTDDLPALFSGDTLFSAGVGNCYNGGDPEVLYKTVSTVFSGFSRETRLFPGHDYIENNLRFTLDREPNNQSAKKLLAQFANGLDAESYITNLALEEKINVFMRLQNKSIKQRLSEQGFNCNDDKSTFIALRALRDQW